ncbi:tRNA pseudouridine(13) synthase TruD [Halomarina ordinaria]|uniref:Probable tRNA pseudouridine synthase D n=1 Tax=Halomarina ordinaria TaxID=3033939 RepID=A0ABD5U7U1_9EURY|nr:tRNA pseudouridine(13) synthase TruD [Halomarina sp. PSRA2]
MRPAHPVERAVGIDHYVSDADGVGGRLRESPEDFRVREREAVDVEPVDADPGAYPHVVFRATLRNWDTNDYVAVLADRLGVSRERFSWAGTKDKRALTTQLFSVRWLDAPDLPDVRGASVEVLGRTGRPVLFGDLRGNEFDVVVRDPERPENVPAVVDALREFGDGETVAVPNVFGQQRFGTRRPVTHEVGLAIARGDWEGAVLAYVGNPSEREPESTREARTYAEETRDWAGALDRLPTRLGYERAMVHRLTENGGEAPEDFRGALETAPNNIQRLFVNAAQSYLFNRMLSARLERGLPFHCPVAGDVVCFADGEGQPDANRSQRVTEERVETVTRHCERGRAFVTAPLVGTETELAGGEQGDIERAVLDDADLAPADFDREGEFGSTGTRRAVLLTTALDVREDPLTFSFALPSGSYATVLMREFLKVDPASMR